MAEHKFSVTIGLLGYVSAGKTTLMNALFGDMYGEVSTKGTTKAVNVFRIASTTQNDGGGWNLLGSLRPANAGTGVEVHDTGSAELASHDSGMVGPEPSPRSAASILEEITADNATLGSKSNEVHVKTFDVELPKNLFPMRKDTGLVVIDIPGFDEKGAGSKYQDYVTDDCWSSLDVLIAVLDGRLSVNEKIKQLLKLISENLKVNKKKPAVLIVPNKVDNPTDKEQVELIEELRVEVDGVFGWARQAGLTVEFIPICARHGLFRQCISRMSPVEFQQFPDMDLVDAIGKEQLGWQPWSEVPDEQKRQVLYRKTIGRDPTPNQQGFYKLFESLERLCGGEKRQAQLIETQLLLMLTEVTPSGCLIAGALESIDNKCLALYGENGARHRELERQALFRVFSRKFEENKKAALREFSRTGPETVHLLAGDFGPMTQLDAFLQWTQKNGWMNERRMAIESMRALVQSQVEVPLKKSTVLDKPADVTAIVRWRLPVVGRLAETKHWKGLSYLDYELIFISVAERVKNFSDHFPEECDLIREKLREVSNVEFVAVNLVKCDCGVSSQEAKCVGCGKFGHKGDQCTDCTDQFTGAPRITCLECAKTFATLPKRMAGLKRSYSARSGRAVPDCAELYESVVSVKVPGSPTDDPLMHHGHFGYLARKYCKEKESFDAAVARAAGN